MARVMKVLEPQLYERLMTIAKEQDEVPRNNTIPNSVIQDEKIESGETSNTKISQDDPFNDDWIPYDPKTSKLKLPKESKKIRRKNQKNPIKPRKPKASPSVKKRHSM